MKIEKVYVCGKCSRMIIVGVLIQLLSDKCSFCFYISKIFKIQSVSNAQYMKHTGKCLRPNEANCRLPKLRSNGSF